MPTLTLPVQPDGLIIDVLLGVSGAEAHKLIAAAQPVPRPVFARAVLDTGTDATAVSPRIVQALGLVSSGTAQTHTAAGPVNVPYYEVSLSLLPSAQALPFFVDPRRLVTELAQPLPGSIEALIGLDVLLQLIFTLDGPARTFTLSY
jgi:hypothetical protein